MSETNLAIMNQDPSAAQDGLRPLPESVVVLDEKIPVYAVPPNTELRQFSDIEIAVNDPHTFKALIEGGLDALPEDGYLRFIRLNHRSFGSPIRVKHLQRNGDTISFSEFTQSLLIRGNAEPEGDEVAVDRTKAQEFMSGLDLFFQDYIPNNPALRAARKDRLGEAFRRLGFTSANSREHMDIPTPARIMEGTEALWAQGILVPKNVFVPTGKIDGNIYTAAFADGAFPASAQLGWFRHDIMTDHYEPLVAFREWAMTPATLYARAIHEQESVTGRVFPDQYEINKESPQKVEVELEGQDKIGHASLTLDIFTSRLDNILNGIDMDPEAPEQARLFEEIYMDVVTEMVNVILNSGQRQELVDFLESKGSKALDPETDSFSHEIYMKELLKDAQQFWGIIPEKREVVVEDSNVSRADDHLVF